MTFAPSIIFVQSKGRSREVWTSLQPSWNMLAAAVFALAALAAFADAGYSQSSLPFPLKSPEIFTLDYDSVHNSKCREDSEEFLRALKNLKLWAVKMFDASGKVTSGVLRGNVQWLGDDMECFSVASKPWAPEDDPDNIRGQYCAVRIFAEPRGDAVDETSDLVDIYDLIHTHNALQNSADDRIIFFPSFSPLTFGLCIPRSCSYVDLEAALTEWISPFNSSDVDLQVLVRPDSCSKESHNKFSTRTYLTVGFCVAMTLVGIAGAMYEFGKERLMRENDGKPTIEGKWTRVFLTFSFRSNLRQLLDLGTPMDEIGCIHGIRAFFCIFLYLLHKSFVGLHASLSNREDIAFFLDGPKSMVLRSFWNFVDTFVVLSGMLTSYYTIKRLQEGKKLNILKMYVQRYVKFTPMFFVCVLLVANVVEYMVTDSQYTRLFQLFSRSCRDGWINTVTYTNTFKGFDNMCYQPAHQLETDMQMYLLAPFFVLALWKLKAVGVLCILGMMGLLSVYKYFIVIKESLATVLFYGIGVDQVVKSANLIYLDFVQRLVPYLSGILLGYFLRLREKNFKLSKDTMIIGSALAMWSFYYTFYNMVHASVQGYVYDSRESAKFGALQPLASSFAICWFIFVCVTGQAEWINRKLKWRGFLITSRLAYAFYLIQIPIMMVEVGRNPNPTVFSPLSMLDLNTFVISVLMAVWLTLIFVYPIVNMWKILEQDAKPHPVANGQQLTNGVKKE